MCADQICHEACKAGRIVVHWRIAHCQMVAAVEDNLKPVPVYKIPKISGEEVQVCCKC